MKALKVNQNHRGFTLLELTVAMMVGLMIATTTLTLFNNQLAMFSSLRSQDFLLKKAPQINSLLNRIVPQANGFQMFKSFNDIGDDSKGVIKKEDKASVLVLRFQKPATLEYTYSAIAFDSSTKDLNYYNNLNKPTDLDPNNPSWKIASNVDDVTFYVENGVIRITITGKEDTGEMTFSFTTLN